MIKFTNEYDNRQFISIAVKPGEMIIDDLIIKIKDKYPAMKAIHVVFDE